MTRKKIAVFTDYALRTPSFTQSYTLFKEQLFKTNNEFEIEQQKDAEETEDNQMLSVERMYWQAEMRKDDVEDFYLKSIVKKSDYDLRNSTWQEYFFNPEHLKKFVEEYSFNLYADAEVPCKRDIDYLNIAQAHLFDVVIVDECITSRKKLNTFYYLSKIRVMPQAVIFLGTGQNIAEEAYYGVWNPKKKEEQCNVDGEGGFELWLKELEGKLNEENNL